MRDEDLLRAEGRNLRPEGAFEGGGLTERGSA